MQIVGLDLTDPYARAPRPVDVAVLDPHTRNVRFPSPLAWAPSGAHDMSREITLRFPPDRNMLVLDAPQALAAPGRSVRACERACRAPGRTSDVLPEPGSRPFAGFIKGSVEVWAALVRSGVWKLGSMDPDGRGVGTLYEAYPGDFWQQLAGRGVLTVKTKAEGRRQRADLLRHLGFDFDGGGPVTHDQLDAAACAVLGYWALDNPAGDIAIDFIGESAWETAVGVLREGRILRAVRTTVPSSSSTA